MLSYLCKVGRHREIYCLWRPFWRDPADEMVLAVAVESGSEAIVTHNGQLIATALAEKLSALDTVAYLEERGASGSRKEYLRALRRVPPGSPLAGDEPVGETGGHST